MRCRLLIHRDLPPYLCDSGGTLPTSVGQLPCATWTVFGEQALFNKSEAYELNSVLPADDARAELLLVEGHELVGKVAADRIDYFTR